MNGATLRKPKPRLVQPKPGHLCRHCAGTGREPAPIRLEFAYSGEQRGRLQRLAEETGIDKSSLSRMLAGRVVSSLAKIVLLADALRISESRLIHYPPIWHRLLQEINEDGD